MILVVILVVLAVWALVATVIEVRRDGYRPTPTDWSRVAGVEPADAAFPAAPRHEQPLTDASPTDASPTDVSLTDASDASPAGASLTDASLTERQQTDYARQHERAAAAPHPLAGAVADGA